VLQDDDSNYKALQPNFDFTLNEGKEAFVANILIEPGDTGPQTIEVYASNVPDSW